MFGLIKFLRCVQMFKLGMGILSKSNLGIIRLLFENRTPPAHAPAHPRAHTHTHTHARTHARTHTHTHREGERDRPGFQSV